MTRTEQRLRRVIDARLEPDETFVAWTRAWVSRYRRFHWLLSLRNRDFAVVTDRRLMLWSAGFFTRWPRRRVLAERLDEVTVESTSRDPGRRMACSRPGRRPLLLELGKDPQSDRFSIELRDRAVAAARLARASSPEPPPAPSTLPDLEPPAPSSPLASPDAGVVVAAQSVAAPPSGDDDPVGEPGDGHEDVPSPEQQAAKRHRPWG
ncbi:MAG: hypothetical protein QOI55_2134 [Actinomycetota bacterium]|nr:hypothetical protein [Actinomycetota bacterium]